ncbi:hypothetical protein ACWDZW_40855, partial [Streptomyces coeruleorubidus]
GIFVMGGCFSFFQGIEALVRGAAVSKALQGAKAVAEQALMFARFAQSTELVLVNGSVGVVNAPQGHVQSVMGVTIADGRITGMYILADPERLERLEAPGLAG